MLRVISNMQKIKFIEYRVLYQCEYYLEKWDKSKDIKSTIELMEHLLRDDINKLNHIVRKDKPSVKYILNKIGKDYLLDMQDNLNNLRCEVLKSEPDVNGFKQYLHNIVNYSVNITFPNT